MEALLLAELHCDHSNEVHVDIYAYCADVNYMFATPGDTHKLFIVQKLQVQILGAKVLLNTLQTVF